MTQRMYVLIKGFRIILQKVTEHFKFSFILGKL